MCSTYFISFKLEIKKRTVKIAFPEIVFADSLTDIVPKFYRYTSGRSLKNVVGKIKKLYTQKTLEDYKKALEQFKSTYNNVIHKKLIEKYLSNVENLYKYSYNIRNFLFSLRKY